MYWSPSFFLRGIDTCQNKVSADQYHVTISLAQVFRSSRSRFLKLTADQVLVFDWITGSCQVNLLKTGRVVWKPLNPNPGLKVNRFKRFITFSSVQMFFAALSCVYCDY